MLILFWIRGNWLSQSAFQYALQHFTTSEPYIKLTNLIINRAPKLASKTCWPSHLERQNVNLALKILYKSTAAGLSSFYNENTTNENRHTVKFIPLINKIWNIFNVNWIGKDIRFNNPNFAPLHLNDTKISFVNNVVKWLDCCKSIPTSIRKITSKTFTSFIHTCIALPLLVQRFTLECGFEFC